MKTKPLVLLGLTLAALLALATMLAVPATAAEGKGKGRPGENHPIHRAIKELQEVKTYLEKAPHDFGGHRKEALEDCEKAVKQLQKALEFDREHDKKK